MRKLTKVVSVLLSVVMLISITLCAPFTVSATEQSNTTLDNLEIYKAQCFLGTAYDEHSDAVVRCNTIYKNYIGNDVYSPSKDFLDLCYNDEDLMRNYYEWKLYSLAANPSSAIDKVAKREDYYESLIISMYSRATAENSEFKKFINNKIVKNTNKFIGTLCDIAKVSTISQLVDKLDVNSPEYIAMIKQGVERNYASGIVGKFSSNLNKIISASNTIYDLSQRISVYGTMAELDDSTKLWIDQMYKACSANETDTALTAALMNLSLASTDFSGAVLADVISTTFSLSKWAVKAVIDEGVKTLIGSNPVVMAVFSGLKAGKTICNLFFNTDDVCEQLYLMECIYEVESLARKVIGSCSDTFLNTQSLSNAQSFIYAVDCYFEAIIDLDIDCMEKFLDKLYNGGIIKGNKNDYNEHISALEDLRSVREKNYNDMISYFKAAVKTNYPDDYKDYFGDNFIVPVKSVTETPTGYTAIYNATDFYNIRNNTTGNYILMTDIDLSVYDNWSIIDNFHGVLDGNGHIVKSLCQNTTVTTSTVYAGLIGTNTGNIKNIGIENANITVTSTSGVVFGTGVVAVNQGTIKNCFITGTINVKVETANITAVGSICAYNTSNMDYCHSLCDITVVSGDDAATQLEVGGIIGENTKSIANCVNSGKLDITNKNGLTFAAGVIGKTTTSISDCGNHGNLFVKNENSTIYAGGITGTINGDLSLSRCFNYGHIQASSTFGNSYAGGIAGIFTVDKGATTSSQNYNDGSVTARTESSAAKASAGGITGVLQGYYHIENSYNNGEIRADSTGTNASAGGIVGNLIQNISWGTVQYSYNTGEVSSSNLASAGGILGAYSYSFVIIEDAVSYCYSINSKFMIGSGSPSEVISSNCINYHNNPDIMKKNSSFVGFDFNSIWTMYDNDYPYPSCKNNLRIANVKVHFLTQAIESKGIIVTEKKNGGFSSDTRLKVDNLEITNEKIVYDISLMKGETVVQPTASVTVKIPVPDTMDGVNCKVYHKAPDDTYTDMNAVYKDGYMVFTTDHLSVYVLTTRIGLNVTEVSFNIDSYTMFANQSFTATATAYPLNAIEKNISYYSSNTSIATIDKNTGKVTPTSFGKVKITATTDNGVSDEYTLEILPFNIKSDGNTFSITKYIGNDTDITIPLTVQGKKITSIGSGAFAGCTSLTNITIPDSVTSIGYGAFTYCTSLTSITIPDNVTNIDSMAFYNTAYYNNRNNWDNNVLYIGKHLIVAKGSIKGSYSIKNGTITIADGAFDHCTSLTSITIPNSVTNIGEIAFNGCSNLKDIYYPKSAEDWNCITIGSYNDGLKNAKLHFIGDVNGDGNITIADATELQKYLANIVDFDDEQFAVADTNGDGSVSIADATQIQKYLANIIPSLG